MKKSTVLFNTLLFFSVLYSGSLFAQLNMNFIGNLDYQSLHNTGLNDVWGYVDEFGTEYALVGAQKGTSVVSLENPASPLEVFWEPGMESVWRDLKTNGDYAYVTTEAMMGLQIIDLSPLPASTNLSTYYYNGPIGNEWFSAHNLYIDENGYGYIFGANRGNGGVIILDLFTNPTSPIEVGTFDDWYVHDGFVRNDTMYLGHINNGFLSIVDVSDKANPVLLGTKTTPSTFTHNIWPSDNGQFVFTTDEVSDGYIGAYDITDVNNIIEVDRIQSSPGANIVPHNAHVLNDFIVTSYYADGVVIHDATYPYNLIEVGHYDTYPSQSTSYDGCWGAYPFLPSGNVLASDREYGLFVLGSDYLRASYLEGDITEFGSGSVIPDVTVQINTDQQLNSSDNIGHYATGSADEGTVSVTYSKVGYYSVTDNVNLVRGTIVYNDVVLEAIPPYNLDVTVLELGSNLPIENASVRFTGSALTHDGVTNALGEESLTMYYEEVYNVSVGKWGYITTCQDYQVDATTGTLTLYLEKGYYDDFTFDFGWLVSGSAVTGQWERAVPIGTQENANPNVDAPWDCNDLAFVTGNDPNWDFNTDDVDQGTVVLFSPSMDLTTYSDPHINYSRWFYSLYGPNAPDDTLRILLSNGIVTKEIDKVGSDQQFFDQWIWKSIRISDYLVPTANVRVTVRTSDIDPNENVTEAAFDHFFISNVNTADVESLIATEWSVSPNPFTEVIEIKNAPIGAKYSVYDVAGRIVEKGSVTQAEFSIQLTAINNGFYFVTMENRTVKLLKN